MVLESDNDSWGLRTPGLHHEGRDQYNIDPQNRGEAMTTASGIDATASTPAKPPRTRIKVVVAMTALGALLSGVILALVGVTATLGGLVLLAAVVTTSLLFWRRKDEIVVVAILGVNLLIDWYQFVDSSQLLRLPVHITVLSTVLALALVAQMYLGRSVERPWTSIPHPALWLMLLLLAALAMFRGQTVVGSVKNYVNVFVNPVLMYMVGIQLGAEMARIRLLIGLLAGWGAAIAIHTVTYVSTGVFLLGTNTLDQYLRARNDFTLLGGASRAGSFLYNPDNNGTFLALMLLLPLGLWSASKTRWHRVIYLGEAAVIVLALLFTYSTASWVAVAAGLVFFMVFVSRGSQRWALLGAFCSMGIVIVAALSGQLETLIQHSSNPNEVLLREGGWTTAIRIIAANPLTGLGGDIDSYELLSRPYRTPLGAPLTHPHESYLELAALGGLPILMLFGAIVCSGLWLGVRKWQAIRGRDRGILGAALLALVVLSINSLATIGWTLAPVAIVAWLIFGIVASPMRQRIASQSAGEEGESDPDLTAG